VLVLPEAADLRDLLGGAVAVPDDGAAGAEALGAGPAEVNFLATGVAQERVGLPAVVADIAGAALFSHSGKNRGVFVLFFAEVVANVAAVDGVVPVGVVEFLAGLVGVVDAVAGEDGEDLLDDGLGVGLAAGFVGVVGTPGVVVGRRHL